jgi:signal transduction histidine kinase
MAFTFTSISGQLFVYALLIGTFSYSRFAARTLAQDRLALNQIRVRLTEEIDSQKSEIQRQLTDALSPFLATFNSLGSISGASSQIQSLINQVIRPLSHSLHQSAEKSDTPSVDLNQVRKEIRKIPLRQRLSREVPISKAVSPLISFVTFINFPLIGFVYLYGYEAVAPVWIPFLAIEVLLFFAIRRIGADLAIKSYSIIMLSLFLAIVNAALLYIIGSNLFAHYPSDIVAAFALSVFLLSFGSSIFEILLEGVRQNLASAEQTNEDLAKGSAILRQELQALNKRASREIHGGVQAKLQGLAIRISQETEFTQFDFDAIANEILSSYETLTLEPQPREIRSDLHELAEFWRGITSIEIAISDDVASRLNDDPVAAECLAEIARESINNSIKHAGATSMRIEISITSESDYEICISNNVNKERNLGDPSGLGTKIFDELADNWNFQGSLNSGLLLARVSSHLAIK